MEFRKVSNAKPVVDFVAKTLIAKIEQSESVFWLLTGGSTAGLAVDISERLRGKDLTKLTVSLIDERYGPAGHKNSNWALLDRLGFGLQGAKLEPILSNMRFSGTVKAYEDALGAGLNEDYKIALMGIGPDSHIAGIKPNSPAVEATSLAVGYDWDDFKGRITMTFEAIKMLDCSVSYLHGQTKKEAIASLQKNLPLNEYPSQILKQVKEAIIFNDIEEGII